MAPEIAAWIVLLAGVYIACGAAFAVAFVAVGVSRVDSKARESGLGFRLLIVPAAAALWPLLAFRWRRATEAR